MYFGRRFWFFVLRLENNIFDNNIEFLVIIIFLGYLGKLIIIKSEFINNECYGKGIIYLLIFYIRIYLIIEDNVFERNIGRIIFVDGFNGILF